MLIAKEFLVAIGFHSTEGKKKSITACQGYYSSPKNYPMIYPQAILGVCDFILSDKYNRSYI